MRNETADIQYWVDMFGNKTTRDLEMIEKAVEVILRERDEVKYASIKRGNRVASGLQAA